jgi:nicotinamide-nucleotide amidase
MTDAIESAAKLLIDNNLTIAFAESATAGRASAYFSLACNAGRFLKGGFVCYDADLKIKQLGVSKELIEEFTPESMEVTGAIAAGLGKLIEADIHVGITGLPCPGGSETAEKPVGTMFIYALYKGLPFFEEQLTFDGNHLEIVDQTVEHIGALLNRHISALF